MNNSAYRNHAIPHKIFLLLGLFQGRPYMEKMKWDRTEMLYWLSEERKQQGIKYEALTKGIQLPLKPAQLEPIMGVKHS